MAYERGFKSWANKIADETRRELDLDPYDRLDPRVLAEWLAVPVFDLSSLLQDAPSVGHLLTVEKGVFSAVTVFDGTRRAIVHNDRHAPSRQNSNLAHELSHGLLGHPPTAPLDDSGCRIWNQNIEDEASWLAGSLLISEAATLEIARGRLDVQKAGRVFGVSDQFVRYRLNTTGAIRRNLRERAKRR